MTPEFALKQLINAENGEECFPNFSSIGFVSAKAVIELSRKLQELRTVIDKLRNDNFLL